MIYIDQDLHSFCRKYELEVGVAMCDNCKMEFELKVPIAIKGYRGLEMVKHGCPDSFLAATFTPTSKEEINFWNKIL